MTKIKKDKIIAEIYGPITGDKQKLPLYMSRVPAGFPSPAEDFIDKKLDLNEHMVKHPAATFFVKVQGNSMVGAGIHHGDVLVVDRALEAENRKIVVAALNGELTVKRLRKSKGRLFLASENPEFKEMEVTSEMSFEVWGVVTNVIHQV